MTDVRLLPAPACDLGESPHWHAPTSTLSWVDLHVGVLHQWDGIGCRTYSLGAPLSAARPDPASPKGVVVVQRDRVGVVADPAADVSVRWRATVPLGAAERCNDAQLDDWGRLWVGTMSPQRAGASALWVLEPDRDEPTKLCTGLTLANGIGWSPDRDRVYVVDTATSTVRSARLDDRGLPSTQFEMLLDLAERPGVPDGLCVDADGGIWLAMFGAGQVSCFDPSGTLRDVLELPLRHPTSVVFVGAALDELVITTARRTPHMTDRAPAAGRLLAVRPGVRGIGAAA
jgi:sugar lactone lactonase YvrE